MALEFHIGELAKQTHCPVQTIRYYEREGLLAAPARSPRNYRRYSTEDVERVRTLSCFASTQVHTAQAANCAR